MTDALNKANEIIDGQKRGHVLTNLEEVKLDLEVIGEHSSAVVVALAVELIEEYASKLGESQIRVAALEAQVRKLLDARVCEECEWPVGSEQHKQHCPEAIRG